MGKAGILCSVKNSSQVLIQDNEIHTATSLSSQIPTEAGREEGRKKEGEKNYNNVGQRRRVPRQGKPRRSSGPGRHIQTDITHHLALAGKPGQG